MKKKSIIIGERSHREIKKLSEALSCPIGRLVESMITYFKKTGINPNDAKNENPSALIKTLDKRIVSFLKVQERDILKPVRDEIYMNGQNHNKSFEELTNSLRHVLKRVNEADENRTLMVDNALSKQRECLLELASYLDEKGKARLKQRLKQILN